MGKTAELFDEQEQFNKARNRKRIVTTYAFDLMVKLLAAPCGITHEVKRINCHATADGFRSVLEYNGQKYEMIVNPLYQYVEEK